MGRSFLADWKLASCFLYVYTLSCCKCQVPLDQPSKYTTAIEGGSKSYTGHHLVRVLPAGDHQLIFLKQLQQRHGDNVEFWRHPVNINQYVDMRLSPNVTGEVLPLLNETGLGYHIMTKDLQTLMVAERSRRSLPDDSVTSDNFNLTAYHTYAEMQDWLHDMSLRCGDDCQVINIGNSYEGRPMNVFRIGSTSEDKPIVWIDAGLHAREWIAPASALFLISKLIEGQTTDRVARYLVSRYTWYILPVANPDGYHYTWTHDRLWRKTRSHHNSHSMCYGVDPNRNWDFHWGGEGTSTNPCSENYRGPAPFSEPETQNIGRFLLSIRVKISIYMTLHSYGQFWLTPWGFTRDVPEDYVDMIRMGKRAADAMKRHHGSVYQVGSSARLLYLAAGGSDDWAKGVLRVKYSYTIELRDTGDHGFLLPPQQIEMTGKEVFSAATSLALGVLRERRRLVTKRSIS